MSYIPPPPPTSTSSLFIFNDLFNNPVFAGGIGLASLGVGAAFARRASVRALSLFKRRLLVSLEVSKQDPSYQWILSWLALPRPTSNALVSSLSRVHHLSMKTTTAGSQSSITKAEKGHAHFFLQPGYGSYLIRHEKAFIKVQREKQSAASLDGREPHETLTLTTLYSQRHVFESIFSEAHQLAASAQEGRTVMYTARGMDWLPFGAAQRKRPLDSVVLAPGIKGRIISDVKDFLERRAWYLDKGVPYRRGYLLHGPPGTGKSSFIQALAGYLDFGIAIVNLSERGMTDDKLNHLFTRLPPRTIMLLEDADAAFSNRKEADEHGYTGSTVTFSGLLNALDGVAAGEERIAFLTTNHIERLDPALRRPGRVDVIENIGFATDQQIVIMLYRFFPKMTAIDLDQLKSALAKCRSRRSNSGQSRGNGLSISPAYIQALCLMFKDNISGVINEFNSVGDNIEHYSTHDMRANHRQPSTRHENKAPDVTRDRRGFIRVKVKNVVNTDNVNIVAEDSQSDDIARDANEGSEVTEPPKA